MLSRKELIQMMEEKSHAKFSGVTLDSLGEPPKHYAMGFKDCMDILWPRTLGLSESCNQIGSGPGYPLDDCPKCESAKIARDSFNHHGVINDD